MTKTERIAKAKQTRLLNETLFSKAELTDEEKMNLSSFYSAWDSFVSFNIGDICQYNGSLFECIQAHTRQDDWSPDVAVSLFKQL